MANSFSKSPRNLLITAVSAIILLLFIAQLSFSYIITKHLPGAIKELSLVSGHDIKIDMASFSLLKGLRLAGVSIFYGKETVAPVTFGNVNISARILPLLSGKISINKISVGKALCFSKKEKEGVNLQVIFSDVYKKLTAAEPLFSFKADIDNLTISIKEAKITPVAAYRNPREVYLLLKNARISTHKAAKVSFSSQIRVKYQLPEELFINRFLNTKEIIQDLGCSMQGNIENKDLKVEMLVLNLQEEQIIFTGKIIDFAERNPSLNIASVPSSTSLENLSFLKNNFASDGSMFFSVNVAGFMNDPKLVFRGRIERGNFTYHMADGELVDLRNVTGDIEYKNDSAKVENMFLKFNSLPVNIFLKTGVLKTPDIYFRLALTQDFLNAHGLPIEKLEAIFRGKLQNKLQGDFEIKALYKRKNLNLDMQANFKEVDFDYYNTNEKHFRAKNIELIKKTGSGIQKLIFSDFDSIVKLTKELLCVRDAKFSAYKGALTGGINILFAGRKPRLNIFLRGRGMDVASLMQDMRVTNKLYAGTMDISARFNNESKKFVEGRCYIKNGVVDLSTLSNAVKFPPLDKTNFGIMHIYFAILKDYIAVRAVKLLSPQIKLNGFWDTNSKVSGVLNISANSQFLRKSEQFRRLLDFTKVSAPHINFRFLLGGIPQAMRFMWLKGEFRDKLEEKLPQGIKKSIEANMNKSIEELSN